MHKNYIIFLFIVVMLSACNDDDNNALRSEGVNDFIWKGLNSWYFWKSEVPNLQDNRFANDSDYQSFISGRTPENLFYDLLYDYPNGDRFSWIVEDVNVLLQSFSGVEESNGIDFTLAYWDYSQGTIVGLVNYVVPNSPAAEQGISRGDIFYEINGTQLNSTNYLQLYESNYTLTFAETAQMTAEGLALEGRRDVFLNARQMEENPVHFSTVFDDGQRRVGYLVFNGFRANYNDELNAEIGNLVNAGVSDLILDLRYNRGGSLASALALAQMITGQFTGNDFVRVDYNDRHNSLDVNYLFESQLNVYNSVNGQLVNAGVENINSLGLNHLYVLTSGNTASASELLISCLRPYIEVTLIGDRTSGKFVGSRTLVDDPGSDFMNIENRNRAHNYAMQPIVFAYYNSENQIFNQGIAEDYPIALSQYFGNLGPFGEVNRDAALQQAMILIQGSSQRILPMNTTALKRVDNKKEIANLSRELYIDVE